MVSQQNRLPGIVLVLGLVSGGLAGCTSSTDTQSGTGGTMSSGGTSTSGSGGGSGGVTSTGGSSSTGGTVASGGSVASGGTHASGGVQEAGGSVGTGGSNSGGTTSSGGSATGGSSISTGGSGKGGSSTGAGGAGGVLSGGAGGTVTSSGGAAKGGTGGGGKTGAGGTNNPGTGGGTIPIGGAGGTSGTCQKGQVKPSEVVFMGESFYAMSPQYNQKRVEADAQAAGSLAAGQSYRNVAVSGQTMNYVATTEWPAATQGGAVKVVIMDGGGIDCMSSSCSSCPGDFTTLLGKMATAGVLQVIYTRYPEPGNPPGSNTTLKGNLDILMPKMQAVCAAATGLKCYWVDLRPVWVNGDTSDGLHPTQSGGNHVGDAIWAEMVKDCIAQ
jgi:hypothetical protein